MANLNSFQKLATVIPGYPFGDGRDGSATISSSPNFYSTFTGTAGGTSGTYGGGWTEGLTWACVLYQTQGTGAGQWEMGLVTVGAGTSLTFSANLQYTYGTGAQIILFYQRTSVTVNSHSITAWDGTKGGIEVICASGTITVSGALNGNGGNGAASTGTPAGGTGGGFRGGAGHNGNPSTSSRQGEGSGGVGSNSSSANANGGGAATGSGASVGAGGGGGGNSSTGSNGTSAGARTPGTGGNSASSADLITMFLGGGGGGGANDGGGSDTVGGGGSGGGVVLLIANSIVLSAGVTSNGGAGGTPGADDGGGGGGAGGSILLICNTASLGSSQITASAGSGPSNGGDGSAGTIAVHHSGTITGTTSPSFTDITDSSLVGNVTKDMSVTANIGGRADTSAKSYLIKFRQAQASSAKAYFPTYFQASSARANIFTGSIQKKYEYRVYNGSTRNYVTSWSKEVLSEPTFRTVINGGPGEMVVRLSRAFDSFGEDVDVKLFNDVEVWCFDREAPNGIMIYSGYISGYRPVFEEHTEYVEVTLLHQIAQLSELMLRDGSGNTKITMNSTDPSTMFQNIINYARADGGEINYSASSVETTSTTVSYIFQAYTVKEALDKVIELTPQKWYWRIDADNIASLKLSNTNTADHTFLIGKHISGMETWRRGEDLINRVYFFGQETAGVPMYRVYSNSGSISTYGIHAVKTVDQRVTETTTADIIADRILDEKANPEIRTSITILDSNGTNAFRGYDIESIKPGQTMRIRNLKQAVKTVSLWDQMQWDVDVWDQTLAYSAVDTIQIMSVEYSPNFVRIEASSRLPEISKRVEDIYRNTEDNAVWNAPTSPTAG